MQNTEYRQTEYRQTDLSIDAEITPNQGLGGLSLRSSIRELDSLISGLGVWMEGSYKLVSPFEARYRFGKGEIEAAVDVRNGKIFKLTAYAGYEGKLFNEIKVGMRVRQAMQLEPRLFYSEAEEKILCAGIQGLAVDVPDIDPLPELVEEMVIYAISVYAEEIMSAQGMKGDW